MPVSVTYAYSPSGEKVKPLNTVNPVFHSVRMQGTNTIGMIKSIRDDRHSTGSRVEPIDLVLQARSWTEILHVAINCVCKVDILVLRVDGDVV